MRIKRKVIVLSAVAVLALSAYGFVDFSTSQELSAEMTKAQSDGLPLTATALNHAAIPDEQNAAFFVNKAIAMTKANPKLPKIPSRSVEFKHLESYSAKDYSILPAYRSIIDTYRQAAKMPSMDFKWNWNLGPNLALPEFSYLRDATRLLIVDADEKLSRGDQSGYEELQEAAHLVRLIKTQPLLIGQLVAVANAAIIDNEVEHLIWHEHAASLGTKLVSILKAMGPPPLSREAIKSEFFLSLQVFAMIQKSPSAVDSMSSAFRDNRISTLPLYFPPYQKSSQRQSVAYWRAYAKDLPSDANDVIGEIDASIRADQRAQTLSRTVPLLAVILPDFTEAPRAYGRELAKRRTLYTLLERLDPSVKSLLRPEDTMDPFTNKPLIVKSKPNGVLVYSVGSDLTDNGGVRRIQGKDISPLEGQDVVSEFPAPARAKV